MKKIIFLVIISSFIIAACSTGKKAMEKGNYFSAVSKAVQRLKSKPNSKNAISVVKESYPLAIQWSQEEIDLLLSGNEDFKWDKTFGLMQQVNTIASEIRQSPVAHSLIPNPKVYSTEMEMARNKAAEERYALGMLQLEENTMEAARLAYGNFSRTNELVMGYKDVGEQLMVAKDMATVKVIMEAIPVHSKRYQLSSEFFYSQVFDFLREKYPSNSFVNVFSPDEAKRLKIDYPDFVVQLEFYDFEVGQTNHYEKEETLTTRVKVESKDTTRIHYKTYTAKLKTFTDKAISKGLLDLHIVDYKENKLLIDNKIPGEFVWINDFALYVGDEQALSKEQLELTKRKAIPLPSTQDMFVEFTKPMYDQLTSKLRRFLNKYD